MHRRGASNTGAAVFTLKGSIWGKRLADSRVKRKRRDEYGQFYRRVKLPLNEIVSGRSGEIAYEELGRSGGYGSFHFSTKTMYAMDRYLKSKGFDKQIRNIFGEGVNLSLKPL